MRGLFALMILSMAVKSFASPECAELKSEQEKLGYIASNLINAKVTRTANGKPYQPFVIKSCKDGKCLVGKDKRAPLKKYLPSHPDADKNGYVAFPNVDQKAEFTKFNLSATKLKLLGQQKGCGTKVLQHGNSVLLKYQGPENKVQEDLFNFTDQHKVVSWMRTEAYGGSTLANFGSNGEVVSSQQQ